MMNFSCVKCGNDSIGVNYCLVCSGEIVLPNKMKNSLIFQSQLDKQFENCQDDCHADDIWNAAIEAAANTCKPKDYVENESEWSRGFKYAANNTALQNASDIRKLKK